MEQANTKELLGWTADIVSSHVRNSAVPLTDLSQLIQAVHGALSGLSGASAQEKLRPAVSIRRSITPDYIVCLEDGRKLKMLKRHLNTAYNLTPEQYREKWGLAADYPMVAPNYARQRSALAKKIGLGKKRKRR
jgi:predicted transcriptional regulator